MSAVESVRWSADGGAVDIIDQRLLPARLERRELRTVDDVCDAIATLAVRGAPAIGVAGAMASAAGAPFPEPLCPWIGGWVGMAFMAGVIAWPATDMSVLISSVFLRGLVHGPSNA